VVSVELGDLSWLYMNYLMQTCLSILDLVGGCRAIENDGLEIDFDLSSHLRPGLIATVFGFYCL